MTNGIRRWLTLAIVPVATIFMIGVASPAIAVPYDCDNVQSEPSDSIEITHSGNCTISSDITAMGDITIDIIGSGTIDTQKLTSTDGQIIINGAGDATFQDELKAKQKVKIVLKEGTVKAEMKITSEEEGVEIEAEKKDVEVSDIDSGKFIQILAGIFDGSTDGKVKATGTLRSNIKQEQLVPLQGAPAHILIRAQSTLEVNDVMTTGNAGAGSVSCGGIQLDANQHLQNTGVFTIGGAATENGVNGTLDTRSTNGGGSDETFHPCGIRITNGQSATTSGIIVEDVARFQTTNTASNGDVIILDAQSGDLEFKNGGTLDVSGAPGQGAGNIFLLASTIKAGDNLTIDSSQDDNATATQHSVSLVANSIEYSGTNGLKVLSDGNGTAANPSAILVVPKEGVTSTFTGDAIVGLTWTMTTQNFGLFPGQVHFNGDGTAPLELRADGENTIVAVLGSDISTTGGKATFQTKGGKNDSFHDILVGLTDGSGIITIQNTDDVLFFARGEGADAAGGTIDIQATSVTLNAPNVNFKANGPQTQNGDGGTIRLETGSFAIDPMTKVKFDADASVQGTGNAQILRNGLPAITFNVNFSEVKLGKANGTVQFTANGGGAGGDGGAIEIISLDKIKIKRDEVANASAIGPDGNGGKISITGNRVTFPNATGVTINADGGMTSGDGGEILIRNNNGQGTGGSLTVDSVTNGVTLSAKALGSGNGGKVEIANFNNLSLSGAQISVDSATDGDGGTIEIHDIKTIQFIGTATEIMANASGNGDGGTIKINAESDVSIGQSTGDAKLSAMSGSNSGNGGTVEVVSTKGNVLVVGGAVNVNPMGANGDGGQITLESNAQLVLDGTLNADSKGNGEAGKIKLKQSLGSTAQMSLPNAIITASGDLVGTGRGGEITIENVGSLDIDLENTTLRANASPNGNGDGGSIDISSAAVLELVEDAETISAKGGADGLGGVVGISPTPDIFDVANIVTVDGGANISTSQFHGSITLNAITCRQWKTTFTWPKTHWVCTGSNPITTNENVLASFANGLNQNIKNRLIARNTALFTFPNSTSAGLFFGDVGEDRDAGVTWQEETKPTAIYVSTILNSGEDHSEFNMNEIAAHEIGHANEFTLGESNQSANTTYGSFLSNDLLNFDYDDIANQNRRHPCVASGSTAAPFAGVIDPTTEAQFCDGNGTLVNSDYYVNNVPMSNSKIVSLVNSHIFGPGRAGEHYPQIFAFEIYAKTLPSSQYFLPAVDGVFNKNDFFFCTRHWANQLIAGGSYGGSPAPGSCNSATPGWYTPFQN